MYVLKLEKAIDQVSHCNDVAQMMSTPKDCFSAIAYILNNMMQMQNAFKDKTLIETLLKQY